MGEGYLIVVQQIPPVVTRSWDTNSGRGLEEIEGTLHPSHRGGTARQNASRVRIVKVMTLEQKHQFEWSNFVQLSQSLTQ